MTSTRAPLAAATQCLTRSGIDGERVNPVYRQLTGGVDPAPADHQAAHVPCALTADEQDLLARHLTSRSLLVIAVTTGSGTRRLRLGLSPTTVTVERANGDEDPLWSQTRLADVPALLSEFLDGTGPLAAAPRLTVERESEGLHLTPAQTEQVRAALAAGVPAAEAFAHVTGLDARLADAYSAGGDRVALSLTMSDPLGQVSEQPVSWSRLWVTGRLGVYRMDSPAAGGGSVHPVAAGDVLGTALPVIEQGVRFAAECLAVGGRG